MNFLHVITWFYFAVGDTDECMDKVANISGSMSCRQFLTHYGFQYCSYKYMQRNCCASQRAVCAPTAMHQQKWISFLLLLDSVVVPIISYMS